MSENDEPTKAYKVGYCQPPEWRQFMPGQSGNPSGRRRKLGEDSLIGLLDGLVAVRENGLVRKVHPKELALRQQVNKALRDDDTAAQLHLLEQFEKHGLLDTGEGDRPGGVLELSDPTMPFEMALIMATTLGLAPWTTAQLRKGRAKYLAERSPLQAKIDAAIGYAALEADKEKPA